MIREVAGARKAAGVRLVDAERALAESDPDSHGIPGEELFYDHVHFTFPGDYTLAKAVIDQVCESLPQLAGLRRQGEIPSRQQCAEWLALTSWEEYRLFDAMLDMAAKPPFTHQLNHKRRQAAARQRRDALYRAASTPEALQTDMKIYQAALARAPADRSLHRLIGRWAMKWGLPKLALAHLQIAVQARPGDVWTQCDLGNVLADQGRVGEAIAEYQKALMIKPDLEIAFNNLGLALARQGKAEEAIVRYRKALNINPKYELAHNNLGLTLAGQGKWDEAITSYRKALEFKPDYADAHFNLALALAQKGDLPEAITEFQKTLETKPDDAEARFKLAVALAQTGDLPEAITHFRKTVDLKPDDLAARFNLAMALARTGKLPEAIEHYEQAVRINPNGAVAHYNLAMALHQTGKLPEAIRHFEEALRIKPDLAQTTPIKSALAEARKTLSEAKR
jgi:tetratricopeptide (TPR) repeat protein